MNRAKRSAEYLAAGGDGMTRDEAVAHFGERAIRLKEKVLALPTAEKLVLAGEMLNNSVDRRLVLSVVELAMFELQRASA